jgi:hypothetical protein
MSVVPVKAIHGGSPRLEQPVHRQAQGVQASDRHDSDGVIPHPPTLHFSADQTETPKTASGSASHIRFSTPLSPAWQRLAVTTVVPTALSSPSYANAHRPASPTSSRPVSYRG